MQKTETKTKRYDSHKSLLQIDKGLHKHVRRIALSNDVPIYIFVAKIMQAGLRALKLPEYKNQSTIQAS